MTEKLYYIDSHLYEFEASVLSSEESENGFLTVLDRTAFFPEGGGQYGDKGEINGICVKDTFIKDGIIYHLTEGKLNSGEKVFCKLDKKRRFRNMQNHSGEHIISGIVHNLFGFDNVGFHLGEDYVTMDFNGILTTEDINKVERLANKAVFEDRRVSAFYPDPETLASIDYRSKLDLKENVRLVFIDGIDVCACCAPHVNTTGEIGLIKILDCKKNKSGVRLSIKCGSDALEDYNALLDNSLKISDLLSAPLYSSYSFAERLAEENKELKRQIGIMRTESLIKDVEKGDYTERPLVLFLDGAAIPDMISVLNAAVKKTGTAAVVLSGNDEDGYTFVLSSEKVDVTEKKEEINSALSGRGGGRNGMLQGKFAATRNKIEEFFSRFTIDGINSVL